MSILPPVLVVVLPYTESCRLISSTVFLAGFSTAHRQWQMLAFEEWREHVRQDEESALLQSYEGYVCLYYSKSQTGAHIQESGFPTTDSESHRTQGVFRLRQHKLLCEVDSSSCGHTPLHKYF